MSVSQPLGKPNSKLDDIFETAKTFDVAKERIKALMLELIGNIDENGKEAERTLAKLVQKVEKL